jgi:hypothetical protein
MGLGFPTPTPPNPQNLEPRLPPQCTGLRPWVIKPRNHKPQMSVNTYHPPIRRWTLTKSERPPRHTNHDSLDVPPPQVSTRAKPRACMVDVRKKKTSIDVSPPDLSIDVPKGRVSTAKT